MTDEYDRAELEDLKLAIGLLAGFSEREKDGFPGWQYFNGKTEDQARRALARLLRNRKPLDSLIRRLLAALIDPDAEQPPYASFFDGPIERRLAFEKRGRGRLRNDAKTRVIADHLIEFLRQGNSIEQAIWETADKFGLSDDTVKAARRRNRAKLKRLEDAIRARGEPNR